MAENHILDIKNQLNNTLSVYQCRWLINLSDWAENQLNFKQCRNFFHYVVFCFYLCVFLCVCQSRPSSISPSIRLLQILWIWYFENKWTAFSTNWHSSTVQADQTVNVGR